jgi:hypothetical protein
MRDWSEKLYLMAQASLSAGEQHLLIRLPASLPPSFRRNAVALTATLNQGGALWRTAGAFAVAAIAFAALDHQAPRYAVRQIDFNDAAVFGGSVDLPSFADRWEQAERDAYQSDEAFWSNVPGAVETNQLAKADALEVASTIAAESARVVTAARLASLDTQSSEKEPAAEQRPTQRDVVHLDDVEQYLWEVYQRVPTKKDSSGDFTWKDQAAAKRLGMPMPVYVIRGMDADFREQLYHAGRAMDAAGLKWSMLSAFRDDYRQRLASGFKASAGNSLHGGSARTGGYSHGRAIDITSMEEDAEPVWRWVDAHGAKYGLYRPMPGADPAHIQSRRDWRELAAGLRQARIKAAQVNGPADGPSAKAKVLASAVH